MGKYTPGEWFHDPGKLPLTDVDVDSLCSCGKSFDVCQGRCERAPEEEPSLWDVLGESLTAGEDDY